MSSDSVIDNKRIKKLAISKPIVYGNTAKKLEESARTDYIPKEHTHLWTVFVKSPTINGDQDLTKYIKKVIFKLHETYPNSIRTIEQPPFEVTETGWGEFEINIKIVFQDGSNEKIINFYHLLRLHPYYMIPNVSTDNGTPNNGTNANKDIKNTHTIVPAFKKQNVIAKDGEKLKIDEDKGHVQSLFFDEIVFNEPYIKFFQHNLLAPSILPNNKTDAKIQPFSRQLELEEIKRLDVATEEVEKQIKEYHQKLIDLQK
ncbi:related to Protein AF-9 homolog [Saccharomycodes ludwigii]|uniref:Protein AF-9 homolog n=1 Tax=Saccharomycodes ludwigii TaxID=36035 RepID=A0A376B3E7_9ASCO|nr:hypothetical protein SCDLUD_002904 [Saccharomycodes ludwigii]KAH3901412.1 hypothetical protein SCDLUD_002904 [Saccharomycodes ludwigii]SSD59132.1 related to Protein AF-9 homolog [Saccharomycodes ludwigii]